MRVMLNSFIKSKDKFFIFPVDVNDTKWSFWGVSVIFQEENKPSLLLKREDLLLCHYMAEYLWVLECLLDKTRNLKMTTWTLEKCEKYNFLAFYGQNDELIRREKICRIMKITKLIVICRPKVITLHWAARTTVTSYYTTHKWLGSALHVGAPCISPLPPVNCNPYYYISSFGSCRRAIFISADLAHKSHRATVSPPSAMLIPTGLSSRLMIFQTVGKNLNRRTTIKCILKKKNWQSGIFPTV